MDQRFETVWIWHAMLVAVLCLTLAAPASGDSLRVPTESGSSQPTLLHHAAKSGNVDAIRSQLDQGANINAKDSEFGLLHGRTPLHYAAKHGKVGAIRVLIEHGANVNAMDSTPFGEGTALHDAAVFGHVEAINVLLSNGAKVNARSKSGQTPLHLAAIYNHAGVVTALVEQGASIDATSNIDWTPLYNAATAGHVEVVKVLVSHGANVNSVDSVLGGGHTPLHYAARGPLHDAARGRRDEGYYVKVIELLIEHGANVNARSRNGIVPLHWSAVYGRVEAVKILLKYGANTKGAVEAARLGMAKTEDSIRPYKDIIRLLQSDPARPRRREGTQGSDVQKI